MRIKLGYCGVLALALACGGEDSPDATATDFGVRDSGVRDTGVDLGVDVGVEPDAGTPDSGVMDASPVDTGPADTGSSNESDCDPLQPTVCAFPWPSNLYLVPDPQRDTGYTLRFGDRSLPRNRLGTHINGQALRYLDGYGLGTPIMVHFPNLNASDLPDENNIAESLADDAQIMLFEDSGKGRVRIPYWAELDSSEPDPALKTLFVRPAVILRENHRYVVVFRNLRTTDGQPIQPSSAFVELLSGNATDPRLVPRQARFDEVIKFLKGEQVPLQGLVLAWDFQTASSDGLHGRMLAMRDQALRTVGPMGPMITETTTTEYVAEPDGKGTPVDANLWLRVEGTFTVPSYLRVKTINGFSHTGLNLNAAGAPVQNGTRTARFWMGIPHSARTSSVPMTLVQYGHGLLGSGDQVLSSYNRPLMNDHRIILFGADLTGFSEQEEIAVGVTLTDFSAFEWIGETIHQGMLEYLLLGRGMRQQIRQLDSITANAINVDNSEYFYMGISQGGIFGATYVALSTDVRRGHLGVPGNNYSTLLHRSVDFTPFFEMLVPHYPDTRDQALVLAVAQLHFDGTDPVSYYRRIRDPLPNTPSHEVLAAPAKADWQVAVITMENVARTNIGIPLLANYDSMRAPYGAMPVSYPRTGSGIVLYDHGNPWPPPGNLPPQDNVGDPHGRPRRLAEHNRQLAHFLRTGEIIDVCGGDGCRPN